MQVGDGGVPWGLTVALFYLLKESHNTSRLVLTTLKMHFKSGTGLLSLLQTQYFPRVFSVGR